MTGFARREGGDARLTWAWEIKSVNGRSLDVRCRLPSGFDRLEAGVREAVAKVCARGNLSVALTIARGQAAPGLRVNREVLDQVLALVDDFRAELEAGRLAPASLDGLLNVRGVIEPAEEDEAPEQQAARDAAMLADLDGALAELVRARRAEGAHLKAVAETHLETIEARVAEAAACAAAQPEALRARLQARVEELLQAAPALPEDRLSQEAALLVSRADVREELDRLAAHVAGARELLDAGGAVGRRLDFLCQEFNREANTLCAKSSDVELTRVGLALKGAVEQLREQVQNIE